jgi:hypothetical protein
VLIREAAITNFVVFGLTRSVLETTVCRTREEHSDHYTTDVVVWYELKLIETTVRK